ncbi:hypothetical protein SDRG_02452 [Saprolegnia diclina VS20]|uniref:RING-type domain-containing protein n=1 Tax=Saprolegnia diclina (strain VS20) TaxID=1156394 RepID=T0QR16_SAPDV|nr:hypothetical protein SDRG_02452 [Saprolegnia diclina VS20]EQC40564.1 hypothetical protein SDRG_02452 [Saprolegnia diclina VS20]|eukprot:XP_008606263.1 hypothetical protein SDRG_02452 [Saprolegnia diclina VS20]
MQLWGKRSPPATGLPDVAATYRVRISATRETRKSLATYTLYHISVSCLVSREWRIIQRRYSDFFALRDALADLQRRAFGAPWAAALSPIVDGPFPAKRYFRDTRSIVRERMRLFKSFVGQLLRFRHHYLALLQRHVHAAKSPLFVELLRLLHGFLELRLHKLLHGPQLARTDETACAICLAGRRRQWLRLSPCQHAFHASCAIDWLLRKPTCPVCRTGASAGVLIA